MTDRPLEFQINGTLHHAEPDPNQTVLAYLRAQGLIGTKEGCAEGDCGACTVAVLEPGPSGRPAYHAVNACLLLLPMAHGLELWTAEGIGRPEALHPVQQGMAVGGGSQCGYCTPGFVMSLFTEYYREGRQQPQEDALVGNLCRCTGYRPIRDALHALEQPQPHDTFALRRDSAVVSRRPLESARFIRPDTLEGALAALEAHPEARLIAGGTDLALERTTGFRDLGTLVSLEALPELQGVHTFADRVEVGAAVPLSALEALLEGFPLLSELWPWFASRQIRNRATLGGNLGSASPIGDANVALLALDAGVVLVRRTLERRTVPLADYFLAYRTTALQRGEIIERVVLPRRSLTRQALYKVAKRGHDDISSVLGAFALELDSAGCVAHVRLAYGGVAALPIRARATESFVLGRPWNRATLEGARAVLAGEFTPLSDFRASKEYRQKIVVNLLEKFWLEGSGQR